MSLEPSAARSSSRSGVFRLTAKHVRAIEALADLIVHDSGFGQITIEFVKGRIARLGKTTTETYVDDVNGGHTTNGAGETIHTLSSGSDKSDVRSPWQPAREEHQRRRRSTKSGR